MFKQIIFITILALLPRLPDTSLAQIGSVKTIDPNTATIRETLLLDFGWKFHLGDAASTEGDFGYGKQASFAKAGAGSGAARPDFNDSTWRVVNLPHDWAVELDFVHVKDKNLHDHGFKPIGRQFPATTIGWYRRSFIIPKSDEGKKIAVKFDGVFRDCIVWFNGHFIGRNFSGYSEFNYDVTDYLNYDDKNVLVVRVDASQAEGWFYEGAGIYRHTWLLKYSPVHTPLYGTFVTTDVGKSMTTVNIATKIMNQTYTASECRLYSIILDEKGQTVGSDSSNMVHLNQYEDITIHRQITLSNPHLWSIETPYLYKVLSFVKAADTLVDKIETTFGIRTVRFDKEKGFFLNEKPVKIKGVCCHQDHAGVGSALPDRLQYFRIEKLKEMGCNAYRTSHNPPTIELLEACDRLGILVLDENRLMGSTPELMEQFRRLVLRDRNHPSIILWSLGNEEWWMHDTQTGERIARSLKRVQKELDPTRLCTYGADNGDSFEGINSVVDVRGVNYIGRKDVDKYHREHPDQPVIGTEEASTYCTRGIYTVDTVKR